MVGAVLTSQMDVQDGAWSAPRMLDELCRDVAAVYVIYREQNRLKIIPQN